MWWFPCSGRPGPRVLGTLPWSAPVSEHSTRHWPQPRNPESRCSSFSYGCDGRPNQCARVLGHEGMHRNRSGRVEWQDETNPETNQEETK